MLQGTSKRTFYNISISISPDAKCGPYISNEVDRERQEVLISCDMQTLRQAIQLCIADYPAIIHQHLRLLSSNTGRHTVTPIQERQQIQQSHWWKQLEIQLPNERLLIDACRVRELLIRI